jgi:Ca2+-binding EF-hand superfamily protein
MLMVLMVAWSCKSKKSDLTFQDWDRNSSGLIEEQEFVAVFDQHYYDDWNREDDKYLDDEDFYQVVFDVWNTDTDSLLSEEEWALAYSEEFNQYVAVSYDEVDANTDGFIGYDEYFTIISDSEFYDQWDLNSNKRLNSKEIAYHLFHRWDDDGNDAIDTGEFDEFDLYYSEI